MIRFIYTSTIAFGLFVGVALAARDPQVDKALKRVYPDAQTEIIGSKTLNGVKVYMVKVNTKQGEGSAEVTEFGDFVSYGIPREETGPFQSIIEGHVSGLFKEAPKDITMYRVTNYLVDLTGTNGKTYQARIDAVGRLRDLNSSRQLGEEAETSKERATGSEADAARNFAKTYFADAEIQDVYKSDVGSNFYTVKTKDGEILVNSTGQVYSFRNEIQRGELPEPVMKTVQSMFNDQKISRIYRGEWQYYQFNETTPGGQQVVVRMRPNGDILRVTTATGSEDEEGAVPAAARQRPDASERISSPTPKKSKKARSDTE